MDTVLILAIDDIARALSDFKFLPSHHIERYSHIIVLELQVAAQVDMPPATLVAYASNHITTANTGVPLETGVHAMYFENETSYLAVWQELMKLGANIRIIEHTRRS